MQTIDGTRDLLLTRNSFFVQLDPSRKVREDMATAYLVRRCICGGVTLVGSAEIQPDGRWRASVASDPLTEPLGYLRVAWDCENRYDAIVALWLARTEAFVPSLAS